MSNVTQPFPDADVLTFGRPSNNTAFQDPDDVINKGPITKVDVRSGDKVDNIRFYYGTEGIGDLHGGSGGDASSWQVPQGEQIIRVEGRTGDEVDSLQFITDKGSVSPRWGGNGGDPFTAQAADGSYLRTVSGRYEDVLQQITFHFGAPYFIKDVQIDPNDLQKALLNVTPEDAASQRLDNKTGSVAQTVTYSDSATTSVQETFTFETSASLKVSFEIAYGAGVDETKAGFSIGASTTVSKSNSTTDTQQETWSIPVTVPAGRTVQVTTILQKRNMSLPYTYTVAWYKGSKDNVIKQLTFGGQYDGVSVASVQHIFEEVA